MRRDAIDAVLSDKDMQFWKMLESKAVDNMVAIEVLPNADQVVEFLRLGIIRLICHNKKVGVFSFTPYAELMPGPGVMVH